MSENIPDRKIEQWLEEIPALAEEAWATWGTNAAPVDKRGRTVPGPRCLADLDRLVILSSESDHEGLGVLAAWVRLIIDEQRDAGLSPQWPAGTVPAVASWLTNNLDWLDGERHRAEFSYDVGALRSALRSITRRQDPPPWPCLTQGCAERMTLLDGSLECWAGHRHPGIDRWRFHPSMPLASLGAEFNVPASTLRSWHLRRSLPYDQAKSSHAEAYAWPWDVLRNRYPSLVEMIEKP